MPSGLPTPPFQRALIRELALTGLFSRRWIARIAQCSFDTVRVYTEGMDLVDPKIVKTERVGNILKMKAQGLPGAEIARRLGITPPAVTQAWRRHGGKLGNKTRRPRSARGSSRVRVLRSDGPGLPGGRRAPDHRTSQ